MIDAKRASSSANVVSIRTCVFGSFERISRVASIPLPSASRTSITTTSGQALSASTAAPGLEPTAVVVDLEDGALVALQEADPARGRLRVPRHVRERFPRHLYELRRGVSKLRRDSLVDLHGRHDPALFLELLDQ